MWPTWGSGVIVGIGAASAAGGAAVLSSGVLKGVLDGFTIASLNTVLAAMYVVFVLWGIASIVFATAVDEEGARVNMASYIVVSTIAHYGVTFGAGSVVDGFVSYPVQPEELFRVLDMTVLVAASTLIIFFFDPDSFIVAPIVGSGLMTISMVGQTYKVGSILNGIWNGVRDETTGKLLKSME